jgi:hypothetical protein
MSTHIVPQEQLEEAIGVNRAATIKRELTRLGVPYFVSRGRVWTTKAALDAALGVTRQDEPRARRIEAA